MKQRGKSKKKRIAIILLSVVLCVALAMAGCGAGPCTRIGLFWHNGGTGHYNSYLGFCPGTDTAVVVLSNLSPNDRIPATVLGIKLLQELNR